MQAPSLQYHYVPSSLLRAYSAPVSRFGTLILVGPPLEFLPFHRDDRFPRSTQEPESGSCHLYAGRHPDSKQVVLWTHPGVGLATSFDVVLKISTPHQ